MWGDKDPKGTQYDGNYMGEAGHETRSYLYSPIPLADLVTGNMEQQNSEGKLEHLQDVAGLKLMVMQLEKARESIKQERKKTVFSWSHVLYDFSQNTTMHGVSKTTEDTPYLLRRMIWILLVLGGISLFLYQLSTSIMMYLSYPVTVNVRLNYNKSLTFPAVTLCNLNVFRLTRAAKLGFYEMLNEVYDPARMTNISEDRIPAGMTLEKIFKDLVHDKDDMIKACHWDSEHCSAKEFVVTTTDHGVCFTFNVGREGFVRNVTQTGSNHGLRVRLNVEQYEYMRGPNKGAGIKVLVHGREDVPLVSDLGQAIAPGAHAFVSIQLKKMTNLEPPYGECDDSQKLKFYPAYSQSACAVDCLERYLDHKCNCRLLYMPKDQYHDYPEVCSMDKFINCVPKAMENFNVERGKYCQCPVPCERLMYDTSITYASTSHFDTDQVIQSTDTAHLQAKYVAAKEMNHKVDKQIAMRDKTLVENMKKAAADVEVSMAKINQSLGRALISMKEIRDELHNRSFFHRYLLEKVQQSFQYSFSQGWTLMNQKLNELVGGHDGFMKTFGNTMQALSNGNTHQSSFKEVLVWQVSEASSERYNLVRSIKAQLENVSNAFINCEPLYDFDLHVNRRYKDLLTPRHAFKERRGYAVVMYGFNNRYLTFLEGNYSILLNMTKEIDSSGTFNFDTGTFEALTNLLKENIDSINHGQKVMDKEVINYPGVLLEEENEIFDKAMDALDKESNDLHNTLQKTMTLMSQVNKHWHVVKDFIGNSILYANGDGVRKSSLSTQVDEIINQVEGMRTFFTELRARARNLDHDWTKVFSMYELVLSEIATSNSTKDFYRKVKEDVDSINTANWRTILDELPFPKRDKDLMTTEWLGKWAYKAKTDDRFNLSAVQQYHKYANLDMANMNLEDVVANVTAIRNENNNFTDIAIAMADKDIDFFAACEAWEKVLEDFNKSTKVDSTFFRENFIDVDIYMAEMYYEEIDQQQAYDLVSLWSDIGGSMGLCIGASILTILELVDVIFMSLVKTRCRFGS